MQTETRRHLLSLSKCAVSTTHPALEKNVTVDLARTKELELGAALALVAEFDRWQRVGYTNLVPRTIAEWDPGVRQELDALGFFRLLKTKLPSNFRSGGPKAWIQFVSGKQTVGPAAVLLRRRLDDELAMPSGYDREIYVCLIEAMKNAFQHAYPDDPLMPSFDNRMGKRWWMAASIDNERASIKVAFLDLGITIPRSLPRSWIWNELSLKARSGNDESMQIIEAMMYGQSRLNEAHRGKGFQNIIAPVKLHSRNFIRVLSGKGLCYVLQEAAAHKIVAVDTKERFSGTLILWKLALPGSQEFLTEDEYQDPLR